MILTCTGMVYKINVHVYSCHGYLCSYRSPSHDYVAIESLGAMERCGNGADSAPRAAGEDCLSGLICLAAQLAFEVQ